MNTLKTTTNETTIKAALALLRSGRATVADVAWLAGTSRQLVTYWARRARIDPIAARQAYLARLWRARVGA